MSKWYEHATRCITEGIDVYAITKTINPLTACPNNNTHTIDQNTDRVINVNGGQIVRVQDQDDGADTQGFYGTEGRAFDVLPGETKYDAFLPGIPISILAGHYNADADTAGDRINAYVLPQIPQIVGGCTRPVNDGDTVIHVSETVLAMVEIDKLARIELWEVATGRTSTNKCQVIGMDPVAGTITVEYPINTEDGQMLNAALPYGVLVRLDTNIVGVMPVPNTINTRWITIYAPPNAWREIYRGRYINLFAYNQLRSEERKIITVDRENMRVEIMTPFDVGLTPAEGLTIYVQLSIKIATTIELSARTNLDIGGSTLTGSYIKTDVVLCLVYRRMQNTPCRVRYWYEYYY